MRSVEHPDAATGRLPVRLSILNRFSEDESLDGSFRLWFLEKGSVIVSIANQAISLVGPCCLCLNDQETIRVRKNADSRAQLLSFLPTLINPAFSGESLHGDHHGYAPNEILDLYWLQAFLERTGASTGHFALGPAASSRFGEILGNLGDELHGKKDGYWPCRSRSYLFELLHFLNGLRRCPFPGPGSVADTEDELVLSVMQHLNENIHRKIAMIDLTRRFNTNRTTLSRRFLAVAGMTIMEYLAHTRMQLSCLMLRDTTLPIAEIMYRVGIKDPTHFGRLFRKETGLSPRRYRSETNRVDE